MKARRNLSGLTAAASALVLLLGSCSMFKEEKQPPCPQILVLSDAATETQFVNGPGRDIIDIVYEAEVTRVAGACEYDIDDDAEEGTIAVELAVAIRLERGQANTNRTADFGYFIALTDLERNVLQKSIFKGRAGFPANQSRIVWQDEPVTVTVPIKKGQTGRAFEIVVGLDLTREEVDYNRKQRSPRAR